MMAFHQIRDVPVGGQEGLSTKLETCVENASSTKKHHGTE